MTNIEYDVIPQSNANEQDAYTGSTLGELGCWVDASITRMIQTGIEHSRVPDLRSYLNLGKSIFIIKSHGSLMQFTDSLKIDVLDRPDQFPHLLGPDTPFSKIVSLTSAALTQRAMDYDLQLSFLLKGGRSVGKFTVASWVAQKLGLHLFEVSAAILFILSRLKTSTKVNCYDILGENDVKTEATLQVRLEQAKTCTPCLLVLRHLEAFAQSTQAAEPGKEPAIVNVLRESLSNMQTSWKLTGYPVVILGTTSESGRVPASLLSCFKQEISFEVSTCQGESLLCLLSFLRRLQTKQRDLKSSTVSLRIRRLLQMFPCRILQRRQLLCWLVTFATWLGGRKRHHLNVLRPLI